METVRVEGDERGEESAEEEQRKRVGRISTSPPHAHSRV